MQEPPRRGHFGWSRSRELLRFRAEQTPTRGPFPVRPHAMSEATSLWSQTGDGERPVEPKLDGPPLVRANSGTAADRRTFQPTPCRGWKSVLRLIGHQNGDGPQVDDAERLVEHGVASGAVLRVL